MLKQLTWADSMLVECPHCHRRVLPLVGGECPACHENTADAGSGNPDETLLTIMEVTKYPDISCNCMEPTTNRIRVHWAGRLAGSGTPNQQSSSAYDWMIVVFGGFLGILALLFSKASGRGESGLGSFTSFVPQCKRCASE
jgi:hypothetical protein